MKTIAFLQAMLVSAVVSAQQTPTTGYAPVNGLKMYYEVHGSGEPVVLLHGAFMTIPNNWTGWIGELSKTRKVIAIKKLTGNEREVAICCGGWFGGIGAGHIAIRSRWNAAWPNLTADRARSFSDSTSRLRG